MAETKKLLDAKWMLDGERRGLEKTFCFGTYAKALVCFVLFCFIYSVVSLAEVPGQVAGYLQADNFLLTRVGFYSACWGGDEVGESSSGVEECMVFLSFPFLLFLSFLPFLSSFHFGFVFVRTWRSLV